MLMLIGEYDKQTSHIKTILDIQQIPRLGKGVDANRNITHESIQKAIGILNEYKKISEENGSERIIATATSFLRDANNKFDFVEKVKNETGIEIEILSGDDEARWTFWGGIQNQFQNSNYELQICTIDIGGGSTEIVSSKNISPIIDMDTLLNLPITGKSIDIGSVRIKERFLNTEYLTNTQINNADEFIQDELNKISVNSENTRLIGIAGTITTLAALKYNLKKFDKKIVDNSQLTIGEIEKLLNYLLSKTAEEIRSIGDYMEGRADIIIPGVLILKIFMEKFGFENVSVSTKGLRYGILLREALKWKYY